MQYGDTVFTGIHGCMWAGILSGRPSLNRRTIRVLIQSLWLKSLTARQRWSAKCFMELAAKLIPTPNLEDQETVFVWPLSIDQPGMRGSVGDIRAQWVFEVLKPSYHGKVQSLRDSTFIRLRAFVSNSFNKINMNCFRCIRWIRCWVKCDNCFIYKSLYKIFWRCSFR